MGIHGIFKEIGPGTRTSLARLSAAHYTAHTRCLRLAVDISIWLFQIQSSKGGSNPALRTFYYRLLRLLSLNIHAVFVFDGPHKPLFKRHKRVGGPGVKVSSVPEFLAKQLLKQFGLPWHVAPGEAEAECAVLQREGLVDAVLSEDVDTLMFGCGMTLRSWTPEPKCGKVPTHINVYWAGETKERCGLDREGMVLVALMSGGDYVPEGIPKCGPKLACDAARAGFGRDLCALDGKDAAALRLWRERLQYQIESNEARYFNCKRKLKIPEDFPSAEVLRYYTHPVVSGPEKLRRLRETLKWELDIDLASLRTFTADAFDWRNLGGARKFVRNLAPALLVRQLRLRAESGRAESPDVETQEGEEKQLVTKIHLKRQHPSTDNSTEYRVAFHPLSLVSIDLSIEDPDDTLPADSESDAESAAPSSTQDDNNAGAEAPFSPRKKRAAPTYDPEQADKLWILHTFLQLGCPLAVEDFEAGLRDPGALLKMRREGKKSKTGGMREGAIEPYVKTTKLTAGRTARPNGLVHMSESDANVRSNSGSFCAEAATTGGGAGFVLPSTQPPKGLFDDDSERAVPGKKRAPKHTKPPSTATVDLARAFAQSKAGIERPAHSKVTNEDEWEVVDLSKTHKARPATPPKRPSTHDTDALELAGHVLAQRSATTPAFPSKPPQRPRKRPPLAPAAPATPQRKPRAPVPPDAAQRRIIDLLSSPPAAANHLPLPSPPDLRHAFIRSPPAAAGTAVPERAVATKRRRVKSPGKATAASATPERAAAHATLAAVPRAAPPQTEHPCTPPREPRTALYGGVQTATAVGAASAQSAQRQTGIREAFRSRRSVSATAVHARSAAGRGVELGAKGRDWAATTPGERAGELELETFTRDASPKARKKRVIHIRQSVDGCWAEVEAVDLTADGAGAGAGAGARYSAAAIARQHGGRAQRAQWRRSAIEVLDLTGA